MARQNGLVSLITALVVAFSSAGPGADGAVAQAAPSGAVHALFDDRTPSARAVLASIPGVDGRRHDALADGGGRS